jgi:hypothetical protein
VLGVRQDGHDCQGQHGQHDAGRGSQGFLPLDQRGCGVVGDVCGEQEECGRNHVQRALFRLALLGDRRVWPCSAEPPQQSNRTDHFNGGVDAEPDERDAAGNDPRRYGHGCFDDVPADCEVLQPYGAMVKCHPPLIREDAHGVPRLTADLSASQKAIASSDADKSDASQRRTRCSQRSRSRRRGTCRRIPTGRVGNLTRAALSTALTDTGSRSPAPTDEYELQVVPVASLG